MPSFSAVCTRRATGVLLVALLALSGCSSAPGTAGPEDGDLPVVRLALDWTPNTNHTGLYVAQELGYLADAGVSVQVLPYTDTPTDQLVDAGTADLGVSTHDASVLAQAAGAQVQAVLAPLQHWGTAIGVRADDASVQRPRDLDGKVFAGFGSPSDGPVLQQVIRADGGTGEFTTVTLGTSAYEALYAGQADFTIPYLAWEGIEAEHAGTPMRYFHYTDYGFPDAYAIVLDANRGWLRDHPDDARAVLGALQRGYAYAAEHPDEAARILVDANPGVFPDPDLVTESQRMLSADALRADDGSVGTIDPERWAGLADVLFDAGTLVGPDGDALTARPDWSGYFTDEYLTR